MLRFEPTLHGLDDKTRLTYMNACMSSVFIMIYFANVLIPRECFPKIGDMFPKEFFALVFI